MADDSTRDTPRRAATPRRAQKSTRGPGRPSNAAVAAELGTVHALPDGPADQEGLTARQRVILEVIRDAVAAQGYPPSIREMGEAVGLASPSSVSHQLKALEAKGFLRRDPHRPRALEVHLPPSMATPSPTPERLHQAVDDEVDPTGINDAQPTGVAVPVVGRIAAGGPILAEEHVEDVFAMPRQLVGEGVHFMLEVKGDSMVDAAICDGDWVVVRKQDTAVNGDIVAALLDDEATVKTFKRKEGKVWLMPHNPDYSPIDGTYASVMGKVVAVIRKVG
ncbi:transcriptional repressor LexA [Propionibacteriaceae bacterium Y1923]